MLCLGHVHSGCDPWSLPHARRGEARFPEENATLAFDKGIAPDYRTLGTRERLFRRIVARLFRGGVVSPSASIIEAGMAVGDNAVPWASLLTQLAREAGVEAGTVYALDPMRRNCERTLKLARLNGLSNLCLLQRAVGGENGCAAIKQRTGPRLQIPQAALDRLTSLLEGGRFSVGFIHLDVEVSVRAASNVDVRRHHG